MRYTLTDLMSLSAATADEEFSVVEIFHDPETLKIAYVALDIGSWLESHEVLVEIDRFGTPDVDAGRWPLSLTHDEVTHAPSWSHEDQAADMPLDWPPLVVGPFGGTYSPLLLWVQAHEESQRESGESAPDAPAGFSRMEQSGSWIGSDCFTDAGELGKLMDLEVEPGPFRLTHALIDHDGTQLRVPFTDLEYAAEQGHFVFRTEAAERVYAEQDA
ncbi:hypothetical protein SAMN04490244_105116 [Tranquillimonas rosea]|uniref:PRC-barrel domain-containing protein n=1 Tax=Tranquillimonas rosea TaxID=641238 RepID=A0A1H9U990_9RHOB|nr:hypothetical protein [Tranquillimonas rosea]SES05902.1 hypothetical protein SAMN04490244_105116 [Tranquillimonas rosea]